VPKVLSEAYKSQIGLPITQAWGMTETSPVASSGHIKTTLAAALDEDAQADLRTTVGQPLMGVEARIVDVASGDEQPWNGESSGELQVRGPWVASSYYNDERSPESFTEDGWLKTGDVATIDAHGYIQLRDRTKDVIKSGGEWISSVELENEIMAHPAVAEAAVIALPHPKWSERPLACVVLREGQTATKDDIVAFLDGRVAKWWLPDDVAFVAEIPKTSVGKFSKKDLRDQFADYVLPTAQE
jgi:fatty-acyl-CoA synthase